MNLNNKILKIDQDLEEKILEGLNEIRGDRRTQTADKQAQKNAKFFYLDEETRKELVT